MKIIFNYTVIMVLLSIGVMFLCNTLRIFKEYQIDSSRFFSKTKGKVVDYKKLRHTKSAKDETKLLYHPVIRYHKEGKIYNSISQKGYSREYYKVGNRITVYFDVLNPNRIKTRSEKKTIKSVIVNLFISLLCIISACVYLLNII